MGSALAWGVLLIVFLRQIQHYAGDVVYDVTDWITKNKDPLQEDIAKSLIASTDGFISNLFTDSDLDARERLAQIKANKAAGSALSLVVRGLRVLR